MKRIAKPIAGVFFAVWLLASLVLFFYYWHVLIAWLGGVLGTFVAVFLAPGAYVFPLIYWLIQGRFPTLYFELAGVCLVSAIIGRFLWSVGD
jgi:hypothetical protein